MIDAVGPFEAELAQDELKHGEMVVLLVAHHIDMRVQMILGEAPLGSAEVLRDIDRSAVGTEHELAVQAVGSEVAPHGTVGVTDKSAILQALLYQLLTKKVGIMLVVNLVE